MMSEHESTSGRMYFAYGSNMDAAQMRRRCPEAMRLANGVLAGWRFRINPRGVATVVPEDSGVVNGILWRISASDERSLDGYEGVKAGLYKKANLRVQAGQGRECEAVVYVATDARIGRAARPGYLEAIIATAVSSGFPSKYAEELRAWSRTGG